MPKSKKKSRAPKVRIARPAGRPLQLRYTDAATGREVRITTTTYYEAEAAEQRDKLQAQLTLGIQPARKRAITGPVTWEQFRDRYTTLKLSTVRQNTVVHFETRLDVIERLLSPKLLADVAQPHVLATLQAKLLAGEQSRYGGPRSRESVRGYMAGHSPRGWV